MVATNISSGDCQLEASVTQWGVLLTKLAKTICHMAHVGIRYCRYACIHQALQCCVNFLQICTRWKRIQDCIQFLKYKIPQSHTFCFFQQIFIRSSDKLFRILDFFLKKLLWGPRRSKSHDFWYYGPWPTIFWGWYFFGTPRPPLYVWKCSNVLNLALSECPVKKITLK